ncbi:DUF3558 domain-containing protein [Amycolatopsis suaedae]|uniref:DUF3558 domain-containing protein n=1 Tax=Amycolatopsis suaedae TaxID=2510978 RepID=A0A4Q7JDB4_9PSEU|nr:DUF3558 domain-containing protein [Amycolatopsis suaedae]RZQ65056.1 DUF3558 domain-containing protein [Amycolatopsis suaedae]
MNPSRLLAFGAATLVAAAVVAGCGSDNRGSGTVPRAGEGASAPSSSAAPGGSAPRVGEPLNTSTLSSDPCSAVSASKLSELGLADGTSRESAVGPSCYWKQTAADANRVDLTANPKNTNGLSDIYDQKAEFAYFEETQVAGYPAVYASDADQRSSGDCTLHVGVTDQLAVQVSTQFLREPDKANPCPVAEKVAVAMVETLKGG